MFEYILQQIINGLVMGLIYSLMALGLTIIFSILKIVNFSHGEIYMFGGYMSFYFGSLFGLNAILALLATMAVIFLGGLTIEYLFIHPIYKQEVERKDEYAILITFGLSIFFQNLALCLFGPWIKNPQPVIEGRIALAGLMMSTNRIMVSAIAAVLLSLVIFIFSKTYLGKALRAVSQDRDAACSIGINPFSMILVAFGLGSALAGGSGALIGSIFFVSASMGSIAALKSFVIIVLGGMGSIKGSVIAGLILGQLEGLGSVFFPDPTRGLAYKDGFGILVLAVVLLFRPTGLFGQKHTPLE